MQEPGARAASGDERGPAPPNRRRRVALAPQEKEIADWVKEGCSDEWIASTLGTSPASIQSFRSRKGLSRTVKGEAARREPPKRLEKPDSGARTGPTSIYEGTLEHGEEGYGLWLDPAVADDPLFQRGFGKVADVEVAVEKDCIVLTPAPNSRHHAPDEAVEDGDNASQLARALGEEGSRLMASGEKREEGTVRWFNPDKGYGFIYRPDDSEIFFHHSGIRAGGAPPAGARVEYLVGENDRGPVATEVRLLR